MNVYKKLFKYIPDKKPLAILSMILSAAATILITGSYYYIWLFFKELIQNGDISNGRRYAVIISAMLISYGLAYFFSLVISHLVAFRLETNMRKAGARHLMRAAFAFFDINSSGKIRKIIDDNAGDTHMIMAHLLPDLVSAFLSPLLMIAVCFAVDLRLGALLLTVTVIGLILMKLMMGNREFMRLYAEALERMNSEAVEYVRGMQVIKAFRGGVNSLKAFLESIESYSKLAFSYTVSCRSFYVVFQIIFQIFAVFTVPAAILLINGGGAAMPILARVVFFGCFAGLMFGCFMRVMYVSMYAFQATQAVDKLEGLFENLENENVPWGREDSFENHNIEFKNVSFRYEEDYILENFSLSLKEGRTYALVGSSGGGKSTIAKLISGFYNVEDGSIEIGGKDIHEYSREALMKEISFVFQNAGLFKTSIYENVLIGDPKAGREEVMAALSAACCDEILDKFPERENTLIGSKGVHLSGGEKQRIAIARAILKNASIIILDEASAAADPENEYEIQRAFTNLMKGKTVIMIAHRLSSIRDVDEILLIKDGNVAERGSHNELMQGGEYARLQRLYQQANNWQWA